VPSVEVMRTRIPLITTIVAVLLVIPAAAGAALVDEQRQGQNLVAQLNAGTKTCGDLSADELDHVGEYVMFKPLGSSTLHQTMNDRMTLRMGEQAETRMHQLLRARFADCSAGGLAIAGYGSMMGGGGMMGGYYNRGGLGAMMSSSDWSWMTGGTWQHMSRHDCQRLQQHLLGTSTTNGHSGWSALAIVGATLEVVLVLLAILAITNRWPFRRPPAAAPSS
jgi:hypothetical protein